jgi:D-ribitol-5-phosphate cytidylyltransferase
MTKSYSLILLAAGVGRRMRSDTPKQLMLLAGKPMILHSLLAAEEIPEIAEVVVTCPAKHIDAIGEALSHYRIRKPISYVLGGDTRQASVLAGVEAVKSEHVIIHEAARPKVTADTFRRLIDEPAENAVYGLDIPFTVLFREQGEVSGSIDRSTIFNVQLPHKFNRDALLDAHRKAAGEGRSYTDDAGLMFDHGMPARVIEGDEANIKITTRLDHVLVGRLLERRHDD